MTDADPALLSVGDLSIRFGAATAVDGIGFALRRGETLALVGESGSGKSVTALSVLGLQPPSAKVTGSIRFNGEELVGAAPDQLRKLRGNRVGMIFQEPMTSLNPVHTIGRQIAEILAIHQGLRPRAAEARAVELLDAVGIADPAGRLADYPHQLSGGQRQRVMIAMAIANDPDLLIADEPTTALDVTVQAQILELLGDLQRRTGMAILFITHDLTIVRRIADRVAVMTAGHIVETGPTETVFTSPQHDYTRKLIAASPAGTPEPVAPDAPTVVSATGLKVWFPIKRGLLRRTVGHIRAVDGVDLAIRRGETLGVVGESGSGKSSLGYALLRLIPSQGRIVLLGQEVSGRSTRALRPAAGTCRSSSRTPMGPSAPASRWPRSLPRASASTSAASTPPPAMPASPLP